jgi:hypothetical protein
MIAIGDKVIVTLFIGENTEKSFPAIVRYNPVTSAGYNDYWIFEDADGNIRYVKDYVQIIKLKK